MSPSSSQRGVIAALVVLIIVLLVVLAAVITFVLRAQTAEPTAAETVVTVSTQVTADPADPAPAEPTTPAQTRVAHISPVNRAGQLQPGWQISEHGAMDTWCGDSPVAVDEGIYSCGPSALSAPACFAAVDGIFYCPLDPLGNQVRALDLNIDLDDTTRSEPAPWALELADGRRCTIRTGGAWGSREDGYVGSYSCDGGPEVVLTPQDGDGSYGVDRSSGTWTVKLGELGMSGETFPPPTTVGIETAYFAAWAE